MCRMHRMPPVLGTESRTSSFSAVPTRRLFWLRVKLENDGADDRRLLGHHLAHHVTEYSHGSETSHSID